MTHDSLAEHLLTQRVWYCMGGTVALALPLSWLWHLARGNDWLEALVGLLAFAAWLGGFFLIDAILWRVVWALKRPPIA